LRTSSRCAAIRRATRRVFLAHEDGLAYASDLVALLSADYNFCVGGACYPETHTEAPDPGTDLNHLVTKVAAGASFLVTQLFFENERYFAFVARARAAGITVPIVPGIMPITKLRADLPLHVDVRGNDSTPSADRARVVQGRPQSAR